MGFRARSNVALKTCKKNRCVVHVHVCFFFQAASHDQLGAPYGGYPAENTTYDVNQSAMDWRRRQAFQKTSMSALGFFSAGIKGLWSNTKNLTLKWRMAASWPAHL